jgi:hypothetical protein
MGQVQGHVYNKINWYSVSLLQFQNIIKQCLTIMDPGGHAIRKGDDLLLDLFLNMKVFICNLYQRKFKAMHYLVYVLMNRNLSSVYI